MSDGYHDFAADRWGAEDYDAGIYDSRYDTPPQPFSPAELIAGLTTDILGRVRQMGGLTCYEFETMTGHAHSVVLGCIQKMQTRKIITDSGHQRAVRGQCCPTVWVANL